MMENKIYQEFLNEFNKKKLYTIYFMFNVEI